MLDSGIMLYDWMENNVSQSDGSCINDFSNPWKGTSVFGAISLGEGIKNCGGILESKDLKRMRERLDKIHHRKKLSNIRRDPANRAHKPQRLQGGRFGIQCRGDNTVACRIRPRNRRQRSARHNGKDHESPHRIYAPRRRMGQQLGHAQF